MAGSNISSDPAVLAAASRCLDSCIPAGAQKAVQTYLWAQIAGITDPAVILTNARCFMSCVPPGGQLTLQAYLTAVLAGGSTDPSTLANAARCFNSCIPPGGNGAVITYALANKVGGSTDPSTLANAARCFSSCIPLGFQLAAQNYLIAVAAGLSTDPQVLLSSAGFACFNCNITPGLAGSLIAQSVVTYTVGSLPPCSIPTGLTATWNATGHPASGTLDVSWGAVPAGVSNTEVWISFDDFTFVLADVVAAPGTTSHTGIIVFDPYVKIRFTINSPATTCSFTPAIRANSTAPPPIPDTPTGFVYASNIAFTFVVAGWDTPPVGVASTELWTSSDNITFVLAQTLAAPTATANVTIPAIGSTTYAKIRWVNASGNSAFTSVLLFTHTDWETRAGGLTLASSKSIQNNFYSALSMAGLLSKMLTVNIFDRQRTSIGEARTPIVNTAGSDPWGNNNMGDLNVTTNGLVSSNTGNLSATTDASALYGSDSNAGFSVYAFNNTSGVNAFDLGYTNNLGTIQLGIKINNAGTIDARMWNDTSAIATASPGAGYFSLNRTAAAVLNLYHASSTFPHAGLGGSAAASGTRQAQRIDCLAVNAYEVPGDLLFTPRTISFMAFHQGLTSAESLLLYNAVQASLVYSGGGFV